MVVKRASGARREIEKSNVAITATDKEHKSAVRIQACVRGAHSRETINFYADKVELLECDTAGIPWLEKNCKRNLDKIIRCKDHYLDYYLKYDDEDSAQPSLALGIIGTPWCMIFDLQPDPDDEESTAASAQKLSNECIEIVKRLISASLSLEYFVSATGEEVYIKVGASYEILSQEAEQEGLMMRLKETKGMIPFEAQYVDYMTPNRFDASGDVALDGSQRSHDKCTPFTSGHRQQLVVRRMFRVAGLDLEARQFMPTGEDTLERIEDDMDDHDQIRANQIMEVLTTCGGFRPFVERVLGPQVRLLAQQCLTDPYFVVFPDDRELDDDEEVMREAQGKHMAMKGLESTSWDELESVIAILKGHIATDAGQLENYGGTLVQFFALHNHTEVELVQKKWGSLRYACPHTVHGKTMEGPGPITYHMASSEAKHNSVFFIPLDEVRNYFGDHVGLYANWLLLYSYALVWPGWFGLIVFGGQYFFGMCDEATQRHPHLDRECGSGVDNNVLAVPYSVYLALWSVLFLNSWKRRENELKFLWGSEDFEQAQEPRREFRGVLAVNPITHQEDMKHASEGARAGRLFGAAMIATALIAATAFSAFLASAVKLLSSAPTKCVVVAVFGEAMNFNSSLGLIPDRSLFTNSSNQTFSSLADMMGQLTVGAAGLEIWEVVQNETFSNNTFRDDFNGFFDIDSDVAIEGFQADGPNVGILTGATTEFGCYTAGQAIFSHPWQGTTLGESFEVSVTWETAWDI
jgi:hypothetical protein